LWGSFFKVYTYFGEVYLSEFHQLKDQARVGQAFLCGIWQLVSMQSVWLCTREVCSG